MCFSSECGVCSGCCGNAGVRKVDYIPPREVYTGRCPPRPHPPPKDTWGLYKGMLLESSEYRRSMYSVYSNWSALARGMMRRMKSYNLYTDGGVMEEIRESNIEFLKGCTEEGVIYGEKRCMKPHSYSINMAIHYGDVDINKVGGKVVCSGGGLFDLDVTKKQMNLGKEEYEKYFEKFNSYLLELEKKMKGYGVKLGEPCQGKVPQVILYGGEDYTFTSDSRAMCDDPECSLMTHCMINWDEGCPGQDVSDESNSVVLNYDGTSPPEHDSYHYGKLIGKIPKYTKNKKHELCLLCVLKDV